MIERLKPQDRDAYERFVQGHPKGHFGQSLAWAAQKTDWEHEALLCRRADGAICGAMLILFRSAAGVTLAYSCRGPVCDTDDTATLQELLHAAETLCRARRAAALRIDPDVPSDDTVYRRAVEALGFRLSGGGEKLDQTQAKHVFRLNLDGRSEDEIFAALHQKTRYNIRLARRRGVEVRVCGREMIPAFAALMEETGRRDGFATRQASYFEALLDHFGAQARLYMAFYEGQALAGAIALQYGDKTWYLYGASGGLHREVMPNYLLQWEMIRWAVAGGSRLYDFRGVPGRIAETHPLYGLYRFKKGFGGDCVEFIGEMNLVLRPAVYRIACCGLQCYGVYKKLVLAWKRRRFSLPQIRCQLPATHAHA